MADRVPVNPPSTGAVTDSQADDLYAALAERNIYSRGDLDLAILAIEEAARDEGRREAVIDDQTWFTAADRLTAIIEARMSKDLAWLDDDGKTIIRLNPEEAAYHIAHLYRTGDAVSGLPPLGKVESER